MSSQTTTAPASRPNLQERGRRAEQREVNLHELADPRNPNPHGHPANHWKTTHPPACRKHGKTGGERHRTAQDRRKKPHRKPTPGRVTHRTISFTANPLSQPIRENLPTESRNRRKQKKADKRNRTADRCPEQILISTDRKCGFAYARASDDRTRQRSQKSINRRNRNGRGPNPGRIANNRQPSPTCRHPHTHQSIPHYGRNRIGRDTGTTASFAPGRPS